MNRTDRLRSPKHITLKTEHLEKPLNALDTRMWIFIMSALLGTPPFTMIFSSSKDIEILHLPKKKGEKRKVKWGKKFCLANAQFPIIPFGPILLRCICILPLWCFNVSHKNSTSKNWLNWKIKQNVMLVISKICRIPFSLEPNKVNQVKRAWGKK